MRGAKITKLLVVLYVGVLTLLIVPTRVDACTVGVANGQVTTDGRPLLWRVYTRLVSDDPQWYDEISYVSGSPYSYIAVRGHHKGISYGLNEAGLAIGGSKVGRFVSGEIVIHPIVLELYNSVEQVRNYIQDMQDDGYFLRSGCRPVIDANGNAVMFEVHESDWFLEYDSIDPDRAAQGLYGFVVRANEFHERADGTDDTSIGGRYHSGTYNISGLVGIDELCAKTIVQGNDGANDFEFSRYGPGRAYESIVQHASGGGDVIDSTYAATVHGVAPGEDPALTTLWAILGPPNYGIAVPAWVKVSNIPQRLTNGDMFNRAESLFFKGKETTTQASVFPVEAHMFEMVNNRLLPHWRANGVPSVTEMTRVEHQMANDAYSLLDCLDNTQSNNKAPEVTFVGCPNGLTVDFRVIAEDSDGIIENIEWNFGDGVNSTEASPSHIYAEAGTYLVSATVADDDGVSITAWRYYTVPVNCDLVGDDDVVNFLDFSELATWWFQTDCGEPNWCGGADLDCSNTVDLSDLSIFVRHWLEDNNQ